MNTTTCSPKFKLFHANGRGNGSALALQLRPATEVADGLIYAAIAPQTKIGDPKNGTFPDFDWDKALNFKLRFTDICQMLQVFRGELESINDERGITYTDGDTTINFKFKHILWENPGYLIELTTMKDATEHTAQFSFSSAEALGISVALENTSHLLVFGDPNTYTTPTNP